MTAAAFRVIEWVPAGVRPAIAAQPIVRAMIANGAGWCCYSVLRSECQGGNWQPVLIVRGWHEQPDDEPAPPTWAEIFPDPARVSRDDALRVLEREIDRRRGIIATLGRILANTEDEEKELAALRAAHLRLLEMPP
jgi:hypothetical protein